MKKVLTTLLILVLVLIAFVSSRPASFHIERSTTIVAAPEAVFPHLTDFHRWAAWSPWEKLDPQMKTTFSGAESGVGAVYEWSGSDQVGQGRMTVLEAVPNSRVAIKLEFIKPFTATNACTFTLTPDVSGTRVTWGMDGTNNFVAKAFSLFMNMDKTVGGDFDRGLASLKGVVENAPASASPADSTSQATPPSKPS